MPGMDHRLMPGLDRRSMPPGMEQRTRVPEDQPRGANSRDGPLTPTSSGNRPSIYRRNPDGSYAIPDKEIAMADNDIFYMVLLDRLEYARGRDSSGFAWDGHAWVGRDYNRLWLKSEGERISGRMTGRAEALWSRAVAAFRGHSGNCPVLVQRGSRCISWSCGPHRSPLSHGIYVPTQPGLLPFAGDRSECLWTLGSRAWDRLWAVQRTAGATVAV